MTKKMTKKEMFAQIMTSYALTDEEKALINKKRSETTKKLKSKFRIYIYNRNNTFMN